MIPPRTNAAEVLARVLRSAEGEPGVQAVILESSLAIPDAPRDVLADYDVSF